MARFRAFLIAAIALIAAAPAAAHPHMFFDAQARFELDDQGRLAGVRVSFVVDELNSLYTIAALELDADQDGKLTKPEIEKLTRQMILGLGDYDFFTDLKLGDEPVKLQPPKTGLATFQKGQIGFTFVLGLAKPMALAGKSLTLKLYDPTFYTAVTTLGEPEIVGANKAACVAGFKKFNPSAEMALLRQVLAGDEAAPAAIENVGAYFADTASLTCAG